MGSEFEDIKPRLRLKIYYQAGFSKQIRGIVETKDKTKSEK